VGWRQVHRLAPGCLGSSHRQTRRTEHRVRCPGSLGSNLLRARSSGARSSRVKSSRVKSSGVSPGGSGPAENRSAEAALGGGSGWRAESGRPLGLASVPRSRSNSVNSAAEGVTTSEPGAEPNWASVVRSSRVSPVDSGARGVSGSRVNSPSKFSRVKEGPVGPVVVAGGDGSDGDSSGVG
jgi:hypothetical protein